MVTLSKTNKVLSSWFSVDSRTLGLFRIFLGFVCFIDICKRWDFITTFYTNDSILKAEVGSSLYKNFTLLNTFTQSWEVHLFFLIGLLSSLFLIIGYKTKVVQIITALVVISIHNRSGILGNIGDILLNVMLIWTAFLPLSISYSIDTLQKNLSAHKDDNVHDLNNRATNNSSVKVTNIAYFAVLLQIAAIFFFTAIDNHSYDWEHGDLVFKWFQLDPFLTVFGNAVRGLITPAVSMFLTKLLLVFGYLFPLLIFFPFKSHKIRWILFIIITIFNLLFASLWNVGLFSMVMIIASLLLLDGRTIEAIGQRIQKKYTKKYLLFYDKDCGICHQIARIIKRLDVFSVITLTDATYTGKKPAKFDELITKTMILFEPKSKKQWVKQNAVGKILSLFPFGFLVSWIFFVPVISGIFQKLYDAVASRRSKLSAFFGYDACGIRSEKKEAVEEISKPIPVYKRKLKKIGSYVSFCAVLILIIAAIHDNINTSKTAGNHKKEVAEQSVSKQFLSSVASYPGMKQDWKIFSPYILENDRTIVAAAQLKNNSFTGLFVNKFLVLNSVDYKDIWREKNQLWQQFFYNVTKKENRKYIKPFEKWIEKNYRTKLGLNIDRERIKSFKIWSVKQQNQNMNDVKKYKVYNRLIN